MVQLQRISAKSSHLLSPLTAHTDFLSPIASRPGSSNWAAKGSRIVALSTLIPVFCPLLLCRLLGFVLPHPLGNEQPEQLCCILLSWNCSQCPAHPKCCPKICPVSIRNHSPMKSGSKWASNPGQELLKTLSCSSNNHKNPQISATRYLEQDTDMERVNSALCLFLKPHGQLGMTEGNRTHPKGTGNSEASAAGSLMAPQSSKFSTAAKFLALSLHLSQTVCNKEHVTAEK